MFVDFSKMKILAKIWLLKLVCTKCYKIARVASSLKGSGFMISVSSSLAMFTCSYKSAIGGVYFLLHSFGSYWDDSKKPNTKSTIYVSSVVEENRVICQQQATFIKGCFTIRVHFPQRPLYDP